MSNEMIRNVFVIDEEMFNI